MTDMNPVRPKAHQSIAATNSKPTNDGADVAPQEELLDQVKIGFGSIGKVAHKTARAVPGAISVAMDAPNLLVSPMLNAYSPATNNRDAIFYERWANVSGGTGIGTAIGTIAGHYLGNAAAGAMLGAGVGFAISLVRIAGTAIFGAKDGNRQKAKLGEIGHAASAAKSASRTKNYGGGAALRKGFAAGLERSYENGARRYDRAEQFTRGLIGLKETKYSYE